MVTKQRDPLSLLVLMFFSGSRAVDLSTCLPLLNLIIRKWVLRAMYLFSVTSGLILFVVIRFLQSLWGGRRQAPGSRLSRDTTKYKGKCIREGCGVKHTFVKTKTTKTCVQLITSQSEGIGEWEATGGPWVLGEMISWFF